MKSYGKPLPAVTPLMRPFWEGAKGGRLLIQRCARCAAYRFPPREICSECLSRESAWVETSGRGEVFSYAVMHQAYHPGFASEVPYTIVIVKLEEGPKIVSSIVDCPPASLRIGLPVEVCFERVTEEIALPKFRPLARGAD